MTSSPYCVVDIMSPLKGSAPVTRKFIFEYFINKWSALAAKKNKKTISIDSVCNVNNVYNVNNVNNVNNINDVKNIKNVKNVNNINNVNCKSVKSATLAHHLGPIFGLVFPQTHFRPRNFSPQKCVNF